VSIRTESKANRARRGAIGTVKTGAWHSILSDVYHDDTECNTGNNIERENRRPGTGGMEWL
jgi:hypothetical protein